MTQSTIQFDTDGVTLFYIDATGKRVAHGFMEGQVYSDMLTVRSAQIEAVQENAAAVSAYGVLLTSAQGQVDAGRPPAAPPTKPLMKVVDNQGSVTHVPFDPPLADLVMPSAAQPPSMTDQILVARAATPDKQAIMYNMILAMFRKEFPGA
jgi:hypothetical protein